MKIAIPIKSNLVHDPDGKIVSKDPNNEVLLLYANEELDWRETTSPSQRLPAWQVLSDYSVVDMQRNNDNGYWQIELALTKYNLFATPLFNEGTGKLRVVLHRDSSLINPVLNLTSQTGESLVQEAAFRWSDDGKRILAYVAPSSVDISDVPSVIGTQDDLPKTYSQFASLIRSEYQGVTGNLASIAVPDPDDNAGSLYSPSRPITELVDEDEIIHSNDGSGTSVRSKLPIGAAILTTAALAMGFGAATGVKTREALVDSTRKSAKRVVSAASTAWKYLRS